MTLVHRIAVCAVVSAIMLLGAKGSQAQSARLLSMDDPAYHAIKKLQQRGLLLQLHPTAMPYSEQEINKALEKISTTEFTTAEQRWISLLNERVDGPEMEEGLEALVGGASLSAGMRVANSDRLNTLRPLNGSTLAPNAASGAWLTYKDWVAQGHLQFDQYYDTDPDGIDVVRRLYVRSEEAYIGYQHKYGQIYFGRFKQHWSVADQPGMLLTDNPRAFDQVSISLGSDKIALRSMLGELDMLGPNGTFLERDRFKEGGKRRWLAMHRLDWRPNNHWAISLMEGVLYSGTNAGLSLNYANPFHVFGFVSDNDPKNYENNLVLGAMVWGYRDGWTFSAQMMVDDLVHTDREQKDAQGYLEPLSTSIMASVYNTSLVDNIGIGLQGELVSSQVYHTDQTEGQWTYAQRGLATNFSDYIHLKFYADYQADRWISGLQLTPGIDFLWQGEQDIRKRLQNYSVDFVLIGQPEISVRPSVTARFQNDPRWWAELDAGINIIQHENHKLDVSVVEPVVQLSIKARIADQWILK